MKLPFLRISLCSVYSVFVVGSAYAAQSETTGSLYPADIVSLAEPAATTQRSDNRATSKPKTLPTQNGALAIALGDATRAVTASRPSADFEIMIREAVGRQPVFHAQISALDETRAERRLARSALYPQLSAQLSGDFALSQDFSTDTTNVVESLRPNERVTAGFSVSQLIYDGGATFNRVRAARARHREFENALTTRINDLALNSLTAYHDALTHQALLTLAIAFIERHEEILNNVRDRQRLGASSRADVTQASARLAAAQARFAEISESARLSEIRYEDFFREEPGILRRPIIEGDTASDRKETVSRALEENPELAAAAARADASQSEFKAAKKSRLPEFRVSLDATRFDVFDSGDDFDVRAGLNLNYDLFNGGARSATIAQARSRASQDRFGEEQMRREIERDAAIAFEQVVGAKARLIALEAAVIAHNKTRDLVLERYKLARGDLIDVLQAESDFFDASVSYITGLSSFDLVQYALMEHTGELTRRFSPRDPGRQGETIE